MGMVCFTFCQLAFDCSLYSDMYLPLLYCIKAVVCRLYEMLYPCICNVVISCWKSGAYGFVICRGGTDMCFVLGFGRKRPDLKQYRISGLTTWYQSLIDRRIPSLAEVESRQNYFVVTKLVIGE